MIDRLSIRTRPPGWPVMYQTWDTLLFLHWPIAAERPRLHAHGEPLRVGIWPPEPL